jgi:hypothetical protein
MLSAEISKTQNEAKVDTGFISKMGSNIELIMQVADESPPSYPSTMPASLYNPPADYVAKENIPGKPEGRVVHRDTVQTAQAFEERAVGAIQTHVYISYVTTAGGRPLIMELSVGANFYGAMCIGNGLWLCTWTSDPSYMTF